MSTPVDTTLTGLKALTAQIKAIIYSTWQIPPGPSHYALTSQVTGLVAGSSSQGPWGWTPAQHRPFVLQGAHVWPNWHSIGYDDPCLLRHPWCSQIVTWEELGDDSFDLPVAAPPSTGPIPVNLPSPPVHAGNVTGLSTNPTTKYRDKGKGKAVFADPEAEAEGSRKRKSPMISEPSSQPPKSAMKSHKRTRSTRVVKSKPFVESEDDNQPMIKPLSGGVPEVILPQLSTIIVRTPNSPRSPRVPMKQPFGPATAIAGSHPAGIEPPQQTPEAPVQAPPVIDAGAILIPRPCFHTLTQPTEQPMPGLQQARLALRNSARQEDQSPVHVMLHLCNSGIPAQMLSSSLYHPEGEVQDTFQGSLQSSPHITIHGLNLQTLGVPAVTTPKTQTRGCSKTITAAKAPAPAPAPLPSSSSAVPRAALDVPMPDLHAMAIVIRDGAAQIALLEARVAEQDGMAPTPPTPKDASAIEGLVFEGNEVVHPEDPNTSGKHVDPGNPGNLVPEYNSADDMDVEVKVEASSEETDMAT
ncbi:hypothetical protein EDB19DRAFT_1832811 [Suillus lakei]|nr:hypothetical protein EDB19DRAFT_1832811 [Suillus lakei]